MSSSAVRAALLEGDMPHAARLLGRPYNISGRVMHKTLGQVAIGDLENMPVVNLVVRFYLQQN